VVAPRLEEPLAEQGHRQPEIEMLRRGVGTGSPARWLAVRGVDRHAVAVCQLVHAHHQFVHEDRAKRESRNQAGEQRLDTLEAARVGGPAGVVLAAPFEARRLGEGPHHGPHALLHQFAAVGEQHQLRH